MAQSHPVEVEGTTYHVRKLSGHQVEQLMVAGLMSDEMEAADNIKALYTIAGMTLVNGDGGPMYASPEQAGELDIDVLMAIADHVLELSGMGPKEDAGPNA